MKRKGKGKRLLSILLSVLMVFALTPFIAFGDDGDGEFSTLAGAVKVDPTIQYQTIEGWGTAICWWGNLVGTWQGIVTDWSREYGESLSPPIANMEVRDALIHMIYSPEGCNMNVARYIIGGGDGDDGLYSNTFIRRPDSRAVGWSLDLYGHADGTNFGNIQPGFWDKDPMMMQDWGQLYVLTKAAELRTDENGNCDLIVETFANSAPYYMTISGHASGSTLGTSQNGNGQNLQPAWYGGYADYMAAVTKYIDNYLYDTFGVHVTATDPFNEPSVGWGGSWSSRTDAAFEELGFAGGVWPSSTQDPTAGPPYNVNSWNQHCKQEGMMVSVANQSTIIDEFARAYQDFGIAHIPLTPSGDTNQSTTVSSWNGYTESGRANTGIISTHSYGTSDDNRRQLKDHAATRDVGIWQAEVGFGPGIGQPWAPRSMSYTNTMGQAEVMIQDLKLMGCTAWVNWIAVENSYQMMAEGTNWGLIHGNLSSPVGKKDFTTGVVTFDNSGTDVFGQPLKNPMYFNRLMYNTLQSSPGRVASKTDPLYGTWKSPEHLVSPGVTLELAQSDWYTEPDPYEFHFTKQFYIQQQFSQFIKQGYTIIDIGSLGISNANALAAISPDRKELIIQTKYGTGTNPTANILNPASTTIDLDKFPNADTAEVYRTKDDEVVEGVTIEWDGRRMADIDVSDGTLPVNLVNKSVTTYKITNENGLALFEDPIVYKMVNNEAMFALNTGANVGAQTAIQAYIDSGRYTDLNKFNYKRADGTTNGSNVTNATAISNGWSYITSGVSAAYGASVRRASANDASLSFKFDSERFVLLGQKLSTGGEFSVKVDGVDQGVFSTVSDTTDNNAALFDTGVLSGGGTHTIEIIKVGATGTISVSGAKLGYVALDAPADRSGLRAAYEEVSEAMDGLNPAYYTQKSWEALEDAFSYASDIMGTPDAAQDEVDYAEEALLDAFNKLIILPVIALLQNAVGDADAIVGAPDYADNYPLAKRTALEAALTTAKNVLEHPENYTASGMSSAWNALRNAIIALQEPTNTPKTELAWWINYAEGLLAAPAAANYIPAAKENLQDAIDAAKLVYNNALSTDAALTAEAEKIQEAIWQIYDKGDKTELQQFYDMVKNYDQGIYTPASWTVFKAALDAAKDTLDNVNAIEEDVVEAYQNLVAGEAQLALKTVVDFTALNAAIAAAQKILDAKDNYIASSIVGLQGIVTNARTLLTKPGVTQAEVNTATDALRQAIAKARLKPDRSPLLSALTLAQGLSLSSFTTSSVAPLTALVSQGNGLIVQPDEALTQAQINTLAQQILDAIAALVARAAPAPQPANTGGNADGSSVRGDADESASVTIGDSAVSGAGGNAGGNTPSGSESNAAIDDGLTPVSAPDGEGGISGALLAAIIGLSALLAAAIGFIIFLLWKRRKKEEEEPQIA